MKKVLAAVLVLCVVLTAGAALAQPEREHRNHQQFNNPGMNAPHGEFCRPGHKGMNFTPDMPKEIREKAAELAKLRVDLEEAMTSRPINKAKALETFAKMQKLENEIESWKFEKKLERIEDFRKQHELNKKVPPEKPMPKED